MKITKITLAVAAALLVTTAASAEDFTGPYIGGKIGSNRSDTSGLLTSSRSSSTTYGLEGGYNWGVGQTTLGANFFYDSNEQSNHSPLGQLGSHVYGLGLKLGLPIDSLMPYAKLGYGHVWGTGALQDSNNFGSANSVNGGFGLEYKFAPNWSIAGEWTATAPSSHGTKLNNDNFSVGVNYYFAPPQETAPAPTPVAAPAPAPQPKAAWKTIMEEKPVRIEGASFDTNSARLKPAASTKLQQVVDFAKRYPDADLKVNGYTDSRGSKAYNLKLSQRRADAVKAYLVKQGVSADRITTQGYGVEMPVADNNTKAGRAKNRRVEIHYTVREQKQVPVTQ